MSAFGYSVSNAFWAIQAAYAADHSSCFSKIFNFSVCVLAAVSGIWGSTRKAHPSALPVIR